MWIAFERFRQIMVQIVSDTFHQRVGKPLFNGLNPPIVCGFGIRLTGPRLFIFHLLRQTNEPLCCIRTTTQNGVLNNLQPVSRYIGIKYGRSWIDNAHVHASRDGMIKKYGVHGFPYVIIATECERKIAHPSTHVCSRQMLTYPSRGSDKV